MKTSIVVAKYSKATLMILGRGPLSHQVLKFLGEGVRRKNDLQIKKFNVSAIFVTMFFSAMA